MNARSRAAHCHAIWNRARQDSPYIPAIRVPKLVTLVQAIAIAPNRNETF